MSREPRYQRAIAHLQFGTLVYVIFCMFYVQEWSILGMIVLGTYCPFQDLSVLGMVALGIVASRNGRVRNCRIQEWSCQELSCLGMVVLGIVVSRNGHVRNCRVQEWSFQEWSRQEWSFQDWSFQEWYKYRQNQ